jgi:hypothetical protein
MKPVTIDHFNSEKLYICELKFLRELNVIRSLSGNQRVDSEEES